MMGLLMRFLLWLSWRCHVVEVCCICCWLFHFCRGYFCFFAVAFCYCTCFEVVRLQLWLVAVLITAFVSVLFMYLFVMEQLDLV